MYSAWLVPSRMYDISTYPPYAIGAHLSRDVEEYVGTWPPPVALIGIDARLADMVRTELFAYGWDFAALTLADLGNLRQADGSHTAALVTELRRAGILPVLIGTDTAVFGAQGISYTSSSVMCYVSARLPAVGAQGLVHIGSQRHLHDPGRLAAARAAGQLVYPLGEATAALETLEPAIRDADLFALDVSAIAHAEAPARPGFTPSGLSLRAAGQLCYYAGYSDRLSSFAIAGARPPEEGVDESVRLTAAAYAQLVWYFLHGLSQRVGDFPMTTEGMREYVVDRPALGRFTFWRSPRSDRWWIQVPVQASGAPTGEAWHHLLACSYDDYLSVSQQGRLPERLRWAFTVA